MAEEYLTFVVVLAECEHSLGNQNENQNGRLLL